MHPKLALRHTPAETQTGGPPYILVHGAANSNAVWRFWRRELAALGAASYALDLRGHGASAACDLSRTSMRDYADDVRWAIAQAPEPPVLLGWSMGGLAAMLAATGGGVRAVVGLAPSTPAAARDASAPLRTGEFGPEEYGITSNHPADQPAMPDLTLDEREVALASLCRESRYARDERAAGVVIDALPCPLLIVTSTADTQWPRARYDALEIAAEHLSVDGASHWGLVLSRTVVRDLAPRVLAWASNRR